MYELLSNQSEVKVGLPPFLQETNVNLLSWSIKIKCARILLGFISVDTLRCSEKQPDSIQFAPGQKANVAPA